MMIVKCGEKRDWPLMAINVRAGMQVNCAEPATAEKNVPARPDLIAHAAPWNLAEQ